MKAIEEQDHYEVLEVPRNAWPEEIESAYRIAHAAYADDSLAAYSIFDGDERETLRERIDLAYRTLSVAETRSAYDASLGIDGGVGAGALPAAETATSTPLTPRFASTVEELNELGGLNDMHSLGEEGEQYEGEFDGERLRRIRIRRGVELEQIAEITKVSVTYLSYIEDEKYHDLPAEVYIRGFVTAYVRALELDPQRIVPSYMDRLKEARVEKRKGFLLGGT